MEILMMLWGVTLPPEQWLIIQIIKEKVGCPISNADMAELNSSNRVVILVDKIHKHKKLIKKNGMIGCVMRLELVPRSIRKGKHLIVSFKKQRELKRSKELKRLRGKRRERVLGKKNGKRSSRGKNLMMAGRRAKKMANAVEADL